MHLQTKDQKGRQNIYKSYVTCEHMGLSFHIQPTVNIIIHDIGIHLPYPYGLQYTAIPRCLLSGKAFKKIDLLLPSGWEQLFC